MFLKLILQFRFWIRPGYNVIGLGLKKIRQVRELEDTPAVRGMINKVRYLVSIVD